jgi:hypothetical protein
MNPGRIRVFLAGMKNAAGNDPIRIRDPGRIQKKIHLSLYDKNKKIPGYSPDY